MIFLYCVTQHFTFLQWLRKAMERDSWLESPHVTAFILPHCHALKYSNDMNKSQCHQTNINKTALESLCMKHILQVECGFRYHLLSAKLFVKENVLSSRAISGRNKHKHLWSVAVLISHPECVLFHDGADERVISGWVILCGYYPLHYLRELQTDQSHSVLQSHDRQPRRSSATFGYLHHLLLFEFSNKSQASGLKWSVCTSISCCFSIKIP